MSKAPTTPIEFLYHLYSYIIPSQGADYEVLKQCIEKMFNASINILEVVEIIRPYKDDVILALIEALNLPKNKTFSLHKNTLHVLEKIGDHDTVLLILDNFDDYIERFDFSLTKTLTAIAAREGEKTERLIVERYVDSLIRVDGIQANQRFYPKRQIFNSILSSLKNMKTISDPRLPSILEKYISETYSDSESHNLALFTFAKIDKKKAIQNINNNTMFLSVSSKTTPPHSRAICNQVGADEDSAYITVFVRSQENSPFEETPYLFEYEKPLLLFLESGTQEHEFATLVGRVENQKDATEDAQLYIEKILPKWQPPKNEFQECLSILAKHLNFENWGFQQSYIKPGKKYPTIIYDSELCRVKFRFEGSGDQHDHRTHLSVSYGRLHAPSDDDFMLLNKEEHWCWHDGNFVLNFIDGLSPEESVKQKYKPRIIDQYRKSDLATILHNLSPAEWSAGMVAHIWKEYDKKLFEVFNLRNPELWENYKTFVNEMYAIEQPSSFGLPLYNKIH